MGRNSLIGWGQASLSTLKWVDRFLKGGDLAEILQASKVAGELRHHVTVEEDHNSLVLLLVRRKLMTEDQLAFGFNTWTIRSLTFIFGARCESVASLAELDPTRLAHFRLLNLYGTSVVDLSPLVRCPLTSWPGLG